MATIFRLFILISSLVVNGAFSVFVETPLGKLEGTISISRRGKEFYSFRGIPYAEKAGRFEIAQPVKPWTGVKKATNFGNACPQFDPLSVTIVGSEHCNFLNVYSVKNARQSDGEGHPVMVWFHPGAFVFGKSDDYDPRYFMDENVIIVTLNYRMGLFGFLDTGDDSVPPNIGLRDQVLALEFVQKTIESFGGDPKKVTIFGCSAGGASVSYHLLSDMSKGLFQNGISQSGTALAPFSLQRDPANVSRTFADKLNCRSEQSVDVECLKTKTINELIQAQLGTVKWFMLPFNIFLPSVEKEGSKYPRFLESDPLSLMKAGKFHKVPWINGFVEDEGAMLSTPVIMDEKLLSEINEDWSRVLPIAFEYEHITNQEIRDNVSSKILLQYFGNEEISEETWAGFTNLFSDRYFIHSTDTASRLHAKSAPVYPFQFTFPGDGNSPLLKNMFGISGDYGVAHSDELQYLFNGAYGAKEHMDKDKHEIYEFSERFVKLWTSFAKNNKPTHTWKKELNWKSIPSDIGNSPIQYYDISLETKFSDGDLKDRMAFWNKLDVDNNKFQTTQKITKDEL